MKVGFWFVIMLMFLFMYMGAQTYDHTMDDEFFLQNVSLNMQSILQNESYRIEPINYTMNMSYSELQDTGINNILETTSMSFLNVCVESVMIMARYGYMYHNFPFMLFAVLSGIMIIFYPLCIVISFSIFIVLLIKRQINKNDNT